MSNALEQAHAQARIAEYPLCEEGATLFEPGTHHLIENLHLDRPAVEEILEEQGVDSKFFRHSLVHLMPKGTLGKRTTEGTFNPGPVRFNEQTYFPYIKLGVDTEKLEINRLNAVLRHELGHLACDREETAYNNKQLIRRLRLGGTILASYTTLAAEGAANTTSAPLLVGAVYSGLMLACLTDKILYTCSRTEFRANQFARQHKDFSPFRLQ